MIKVIYVLAVVLVINCNQNKGIQDKLDVSNLEFTELNIDLNKEDFSPKSKSYVYKKNNIFHLYFLFQLVKSSEC